MSDIQLSVIIPVYNRSDVVRRTLDSVKAQTYRPLKLILVDNDSTDDSLFTLLHWCSLNRADDFIIQVASESNEGAAAARNAGLHLADTPWVMFFDSDDYMHPEHIATAFETLDENPYADIVGWDVNIHTLDDRIIRKEFVTRDCLYSCVMDGTMATQRYMVRRSLLITAGGWNDSVRVWDDIELGVRLLLLPSLEIVKRKGNVYVDVFSQRESITGTAHIDKCLRLEHAIDVIADDLPAHIRYIAWLKASVLAGLYWREGGFAESDKLMLKVCEAEPSPWRRSLYRFACSYTSRGGRGAAKILKRLF